MTIKKDIQFGKSGGTKTLFVLTGASTLEQMNKGDCQADFVANSLSDLYALTNDNTK